VCTCQRVAECDGPFLERPRGEGRLLVLLVSARSCRRCGGAARAPPPTTRSLSVATAAQLHAKINKARTGGCECDRDWKSRLKCGDGGGKFLFHPSPKISIPRFLFSLSHLTGISPGIASAEWQLILLSPLCRSPALGPLIGHHPFAQPPSRLRQQI